MTQTPNDSFRRGVAHFRAGRWNDALLEFRRAETETPNHGPTINNIGLTYEAKGFTERALEYYARAAAAAPGMVAAHVNRGRALEALGRPEEALESFERGVTAGAKGEPQARTASEHYDRLCATLYGSPEHRECLRRRPAMLCNATWAHLHRDALGVLFAELPSVALYITMSLGFWVYNHFAVGEPGFIHVHPRLLPGIGVIILLWMAACTVCNLRLFNAATGRRYVTVICPQYLWESWARLAVAGAVVILLGLAASAVLGGGFLLAANSFPEIKVHWKLIGKIVGAVFLFFPFTSLFLYLPVVVCRDVLERRPEFVGGVYGFMYMLRYLRYNVPLLLWVALLTVMVFGDVPWSLIPWLKVHRLAGIFPYQGFFSIAYLYLFSLAALNLERIAALKKVALKDI